MLLCKFIFLERKMFPTFELLGKTIGMYSVMAVVGLLAAGIFACQTAKKRGHDNNTMIEFLLVIGIGVLLGGHILYGLTNIQVLIKLVQNLDVIQSVGDFFIAMQYIFGGAVFYGGLFGGMLAGFIYAKRKKLPLPAYSDILAPAVPLFHLFGRIGCFLGGCCYGMESAFGFTYTHALLPQANGVSRFPVQLAEALINLLLFLLLWGLLRKNMGKGKLFNLYLILYSAARFILEFFRGDELRGFIFGLSVSQFISVFLFAAAGIYRLYINRRKRMNY